MKLVSYILIVILSFSFQTEAKNKEVYNVLILSGSNNHEWQKTTPFLKTILVDCGLFRVDVTNRPDTLSYNTLKSYNAIISNWNSWPKNDLRWPEEAEKGLLEYLEKGGGLLFFHSSTAKVTQPVPQELRELIPEGENKLTWIENDTTFALLENNRTLWQFNFNTKYGKPFFHPIFVNRNRITSLSPDDHPWHLGQWFSWKYIDGVNYWEYKDKGFHSEGVTEIKNIRIKKEADYSAKIILDIEYHPENGKTVLKEKRKIQISPPRKNGAVYFDYDFNFVAVEDRVVLDRTPLAGEPNGKSWGGYAGLSVRFNQDFMNPRFVSSFGDSIDVNGKRGDYLYMGFKGIDGKQVGTAVMISDDSMRDGEAWYTVNTPEIPFYYLSPAYLYFKPQILTKGEHIKLKYRITHLQGDVSVESLNKEYDNFIERLKK